MANFWVVTPDGQRYGPADLATLQAWTRDGRVIATTMVFRDDTQQTLPAAQVVELSNHFGVMSNTPQLNYGLVNSSSGLIGHRLSEFPTWAIVLLTIFVPLFSMIWFGLMHDQVPKNRQDDPSAGKAIGFSFIPFFNIWYWNFFLYPRLVLRINEQRLAVGLPEVQLGGMAMTMCVLYACFIPVGCIPLLNYIYILGLTIVQCIFFSSLQTAVNELVQRTQPGFAQRM